jgi:hypothetical protein
MKTDIFIGMNDFIRSSEEAQVLSISLSKPVKRVAPMIIAPAYNPEIIARVSNSCCSVNLPYFSIQFVRADNAKRKIHAYVLVEQFQDGYDRTLRSVRDGILSLEIDYKFNLAVLRRQQIYDLRRTTGLRISEIIKLFEDHCCGFQMSHSSNILFPIPEIVFSYNKLSKTP